MTHWEDLNTQMKRQSGNVSLAVLMRNAVRPDEEEICAFVDATHATPASCKGSKIQFVDGKPTISLQGRKTKGYVRGHGYQVIWGKLH